MTDIVDAPSIDELDDEFDLDIRIDDIDPGESNLTPTFGASCTMCCPGEGNPTGWYSACRTYRGCSEYSECFCTGEPC